MPYPDPDRLVQVVWREQAKSFEALAAYQDLGGSGVNLTGVAEARRPGRHAAARAARLRVDPLLPVTSVLTGEQLVSQALEAQRFNAVLMGALALVAVALAFSGIYGVISCLVAQRTDELGVRIAIGARRPPTSGRSRVERRWCSPSAWRPRSSPRAARRASIR